MEKIKLHLGCGYDHLEDYINVDMNKNNNPDIIQNLDDTWQWEDNSIDHIKIHFVLEHIDYIHFFKESFRVLKKGGTIDIKVPCGLDFTSWQDPTHVRTYFPNSILHLTNYDHKHYDATSNLPWKFESITIKPLFRDWRHKILYWLFRLLRFDNIAYLFCYGVQWRVMKYEN